jgi:hypothetical protein
MRISYDAVSSFERAKSGRAKTSPMRPFTTLLLALFFVVLLTCLAMGVRVYGVVETAQATSNDTHVQTGLMANIVHMNDNANALQRGEGPEGPALVLEETLDSGNYETRIYAYDGWVMQEYAISGRPCNPQSAVPLFESKHFDFSVQGKLLSVMTDAGRLDVALRSEQGGVPIAGGAAAVGEPSADGSALMPAEAEGTSGSVAGGVSRSAGEAGGA